MEQQNRNQYIIKSALYADAGTTYTKIISAAQPVLHKYLTPVNIEKFHTENHIKKKFYYYIMPSNLLKDSHIKFDKTCGHMTDCEHHENEIIALAKGCQRYVSPDATVLDLGSRDAKWIRFKNKKFHDMDWNTSCASSTGATVEMLMKFYNLSAEELTYNPEKFAVTCGIFGLEKIMDDISHGASAKTAVAKFIHGIAYNAWTFAKRPKTLYLSGGFCENKCFVDSLKNYCEVKMLGRFMLCEGLIEEDLDE